jgi:hypothetical protein
MVFRNTYSNLMPYAGTLMQPWMNVPYKTRRRGGFSSSGTMTKKKYPRKTNRKSFTRKVLNVFPAKHYTVTSNNTIVNLNTYSMNLTAGIGQGTGNNQREGDSIHLEALKIEGLFQTATESNAYKFRLIVGYSGEEFGNLTLAVANLSQPEIFLPGTVATEVNGIINPKAFTALYDQAIDLNSQIEGDRTIHSVRDTIKLNCKFPYQQATSVYGKFKNLYVVVVAYAPDIAIGDPIGSSLLAFDLIFKD